MPLIRFTSPERATSPPPGEAFSYAAAGTCSSHGRNDIWDGGPNVQLLKSPAESELPLDHIIQIAADQFSHIVRCQLREHRELKALLNDLHLFPRAPLPPQPFVGHGTDTKQPVSQPPPLSVKNTSDQAFPRPLKSATSCGWCSSEAGDTRITKTHGPQGEQDSEARPSLDLSDSAASCLKLRPNNTAALSFSPTTSAPRQDLLPPWMVELPLDSAAVVFFRLTPPQDALPTFSSSASTIETPTETPIPTTAQTTSPPTPRDCATTVLPKGLVSVTPCTPNAKSLLTVWPTVCAQQLLIQVATLLRARLPSTHQQSPPTALPRSAARMA